MRINIKQYEVYVGRCKTARKWYWRFYGFKPYYTIKGVKFPKSSINTRFCHLYCVLFNGTFKIEVTSNAFTGTPVKRRKEWL